MLKRLVALLIAIPVGILVIAISVANRQPVTLSVPPSTADGPAFASATLPFFAFLFITLFLGLVLGSMATWFGQSRYRKQAREMKTEATKASFEAQKQKERAETLSREVVARTDADDAAKAQAKALGRDERQAAAFASLGLPAPERA